MLDIAVYYQKKAWFDRPTCMSWAKDYRRSTGIQQEKLLGLDNLDGQTHPEFRKYLRQSSNSLLIYTPADCTDLCAVTDAGLGRSIKSRMKIKFEDHYEEHSDEWEDGEITAGE